MLPVESFPQPFPESGLLGVGGDHPTPCNRLEKALGQTDLPSEGQDHYEGAGTLHFSVIAGLGSRSKLGEIKLGFRQVASEPKGVENGVEK